MSERQILLERYDCPTEIWEDGTQVWLDRYGRLHRDGRRPAKISPNDFPEIWVHGNRKFLSAGSDNIFMGSDVGIAAGQMNVFIGVSVGMGKSTLTFDMLRELAMNENTVIITATQEQKHNG